ncbi:MAG: hypothetical protein ABIY55_10795, partial [Kofleriaceae bacterium]
IRLEDITNVAMADSIRNAIAAAGLQIDAVHVPNTALVTLKHRLLTTRGNVNIINTVATTNFAATGMGGGHSGDCATTVGCTQDSDCITNFCDATSHCKACAVNGDCASNVCKADHTCQ